jgi:hypothetical protein
LLKLQQFYIYKFETDRLNKSNYNINIDMKQARKNNELIALADNQVLRSIRKITKIDIDFKIVDNLFLERKKIVRRKNSIQNKNRIKEIDKDIDNLLFCPEYISLVVNKHSHYKKIIKNGLIVNGEKYIRLLCGAGNARNNTVFFVNEKIYNELDNILCNGHNKDIKITESKYNAYYALSNSATYPVTEPRVCVIPDKEIKMSKRVDWIEEKTIYDEIYNIDKELNFNLWDGMGICSPELALKWANDLELDYTPCAFCIRNYFIKGLVCVFDFHKFSQEIADKHIIIDIYGNEVDTNNIDMIITESQFKLWKGYNSWEHYLQECNKNDAFWGVTKFTPKKDKTSVFTNYQFLQVLNLDTTDKIKNLCDPTLNWFDKITNKDADYTLLYLLGDVCNRDIDEICNSGMFYSLDNMVKALLFCRDLIDDTYIKSKIERYINTKIRESYIGKLLVDGNFQFMISDPYALCEHIYGLEIKGLLNEYEHYSKYWNDKNILNVIAQRAPLTWRSESNVLNLKNNDDIKKWFGHLYSGIVYNVWGYDTMQHADSDYDGDIVFTSNNNVMIENVINGNPITYQKHPTEKKVINKKDLFKADLLSFDTKIGYITNCSTTLYSMLPLYEKYSKEHIEIENRLKLCRMGQGNEIDRAKGLVVKDFPKWWTNWTNPDKPNDTFERDEIEFNNKLLIEKRPLFMKYLYPKYKKEFKFHFDRYNYISQKQYNLTIDELLEKKDLDDNQKQLIYNYNKYNPLLDTDCVMNNICKYMESEIKEIKINVKKKNTDKIFDILYNSNIKITKKQIKLMKEYYKKSVKKSENINSDDTTQKVDSIEDFYDISDDVQKLANLAVYINYKLYPNSNKNFAWNIFGNGIILNLHEKFEGKINIPVEDYSGNIDYRGSKYINKEVIVEL